MEKERQRKEEMKTKRMNRARFYRKRKRVGRDHAATPYHFGFGLNQIPWVA